MTPHVVALSQGDPAGIGPELMLALVARRVPQPEVLPLLVAEQAALRAVRELSPGAWERLRFLDAVPDRAALLALPPEVVPVLDPVASARRLTLGASGPADAAGALAALDLASGLVERRTADALLTLPVSKVSIARQHLPGFVGHTEYLAERAGLERYGRDYLMAFLAPRLRVALLSTHLPLRDALERVSRRAVEEALALLGRQVRGRLAVAGLNPHAGEDGLLGEEDRREIAPAVASARAAGLDVRGPESPDSLFARALAGEFDWVLALYHDQGLVAVKTAAFGSATNWTLGLPYLRTSVDHGTAFDKAGRGIADVRPLEAVLATTLELLREGYGVGAGGEVGGEAEGG